MKNTEVDKKNIQDEKMHLQLQIADIVSEYKNEKNANEKSLNMRRIQRHTIAERSLPSICILSNCNISHDYGLNDRLLSCFEVGVVLFVAKSNLGSRFIPYVVVEQRWTPNIFLSP
jgi:hypothetical protein